MTHYSYYSPSPLSYGVYATASSPPITIQLSFPTHNPSSQTSFFIHSYFTASTATVSHAVELNLPRIISSLSASICIPLASPLRGFHLHPFLFPSAVLFSVMGPSCLTLSPHSLRSLSSSPIRSLRFLYFPLSVSCFAPPRRKVL